MCGICGIVCLSDGDIPAQWANVSDAQIRPMLERMNHRGPQGAGVKSTGAATFGTQRLAIRGLKDDMPPLMDAENGIIAVCNGEIDNHMALREWLAGRGRLVEQATDVAVLPALYLEFGESFVEKLDGVFAIGLWDERKQKLILARDRAGERSLFYRVDDGSASFATEVAALVAGSPGELEIDRPAVAGFLRHGCFVAPQSPCSGIRKVRPGEIVTFCGTEVKHRRYWRWPVMEMPKAKPSLAAFDDVFRHAVERQCNVDVDYGFFMSGGLDSSLVAAVAQSVHPGRRPRCYTLRFSEESYDEGEFAERVAKLLGLDIISVPVKPEHFIAELPRLVHQVGEPLADPAWVPTTLLSHRAAQDVRIVFAGEGGDELFGGYPTYLGAGFARQYEHLPAFVRTGVRKIVGALPPSDKKMPLSFLLKRFVECEGMDPYARHRLWTANIRPDLLMRLGVPVLPPPDEPIADGALLDRLQLHDLETTLAEGLLTKADRGGMSASLEIRAPFLDRNVMEFTATLPANERVHGLTTKHFLKTYAEKYLPRDIIHRRKRGLSVPLALWLRGPLQDWAEAKLRAGRLAEAGVNPAAAQALLHEHVARQADHARPLWTLLVLDEWLAWAEQQPARPRLLN
jgi:asparagine synthase (glutamine-hydrolysing)